MARLLSACLLTALLAPAASAFAQDVPRDPYDLARFHFGVIRFTPYIVITDFGVDTNVYNEDNSANPKKDTTATLGPGVNYWFKLGRGRIAAKSDMTYTWFQQYGDQRSLNTRNAVKLSVPLNRLTPFVDGLFDRGRARVSYEIDSRSFSTTVGYGGGIDMRLTGKSTIRLEAHHLGLDFNLDERFGGTSLRDALNRSQDSGGLSLREAVTPLTTFVVKTEYEHDRFPYSPIKDSNGVRILPGFEFDPLALIGGKIFVGYRRFDALNSAVPNFQGLVADVEANYRLRATRLDVLFSRDITYSYLLNTPYYLLNDVGLRVTQKITHRWDIVGNVRRQWLGYREVTTPGSEPINRVDRSYLVGGGIGYQMGDNVRVGAHINYTGRTSNTVVTTGYNGLRGGLDFSYGLPTK